MPTILQINAAKNCGSTGKIAEQIALLTQDHGWKAYIAHGYRYDRGGEVEGIAVTDKWGEYLHLVRSLFDDGHGLGSLNETKHLIKRIEKITPDIIHLHNIHGYYLNYPELFKYLSTIDTPVVMTLHDCWSFTGHCVYFDKVGCYKWKTGCDSCPQKASYPRSLVDRSERNYKYKKELLSNLRNLTIVPVSNWLKGLVLESFLAKYPIRTIHNGIDLGKFKPSMSDFREKHSLNGKFIILGVADGYGDRKGIPEFNKLSKEFGDDVKIVMVGLTEYEKKQVSSKIFAMGRTRTQQELIDIYSSADVYINPTYEDNFPTTNLEALACGTPVITYKTGGSPEAINENTGIVVEKGDFKALHSAIIKVKEIGKQHYSEACVKRAKDNYNMYDRFEEYIQLYNQLCRFNY